MDQEASWVGLGWSLNAGAINRNVNGYPDDWDNVKTYEYYWNKGETLRQHSLDVTIPIYGISLGLGASWGSLRGFSGSVGIGAGPININMSSDHSKGISVGIGINKYLSVSAGMNSQGFNVGANNGGLSVGYSEEGSFSGSATIGTGIIKSKNGRYNAGGSLSITTSGDISYGMSASIGSVKASITKNGSTKSLGIKAGGVGVTHFSTVQRQDDMTIEHSGYTIPAIVINYRYEKVKWYVDKLKQPGVSGAIFSDNEILNVPQNVIDFCEEKYGLCTASPVYVNVNACNCIETGGVNDGYTGNETQANPDYAFSDISEINNSYDAKRFSILNTNPALLNYDGYNVSGQGMAGQMSPRMMKNITLINVNHD